MWSVFHRPRRRRLLGAGAVGVAALAATASLALGQAAPPKPDGGPPEAAANPVVTNCGPNLGSTVITRNSPSTMNAVAFQPLPGASTVVNVPDGTSRCIKVLFTAETACGLSAAADFCYVQATINGAPMNPNGTGFMAADSEDGTASAHAYEWIKRVGPGNYVIAIQRRVLNAATLFYTDDWTMDVQIAA
jgi:hypothetical protein